MIKRIRAAAVVLQCLLFIESVCFAQTRARRAEEDLRQRRLQNVKIEADSVGQLFSDFSLDFNIPVGVETAVNDDESVVYSLALSSGTLVDLLTSFVSEHPAYAWEIKDDVVRLFPRSGHRDPILNNLLAVEIKVWLLPRTQVALA